MVDAEEAGQPRPKNAVGFITEVLLSWDGRWYLDIVRHGYPHSIPPNITYEQSEARAAFFPVYPLTVRLVDAIAPGGDTIAALFVNFVLALVAMLLIGRLALRLTDDAEVAARAMVIFAVFPGSFVLSFAYAEAALIALCAACLLLLLDERWVLAGLVGALATATRPNGVAIVAACAVASFIAIRQRRDWMSLAAPLLSPIGFVAFQAFLRHHTDESWPWFRVPARGVARGHQLRRDRGPQHDQLPRQSTRQPDGRTHGGDDDRDVRRAVVRLAAPAPPPAAGIRRRGHRPDAPAGHRHRPPAVLVHGVPTGDPGRHLVVAS